MCSFAGDPCGTKQRNATSLLVKQNSRFATLILSLPLLLCKAFLLDVCTECLFVYDFFHHFQVDFPLPIVACNLMIEYADFYENFQVLAIVYFSIICFSFAATLVGDTDFLTEGTFSFACPIGLV